MKLVIASRNKGKIEELARILAIVAPNVELVGSDQFPDLSDVAETGETFAANALLKARTIARETGLPAIADDSGLCVDALNGAPGIYSARWSGVHGDDQANLKKVLVQLQEVSNENRGAAFKCVVALVLPSGQEATREGEIRGEIRRGPTGNGGFGYDPIFQPSGFSITMAELSAEAKDEISHRGKALRAIAPEVARLLA